jgi:hypothetical protein
MIKQATVAMAIAFTSAMATWVPFDGTSTPTPPGRHRLRGQGRPYAQDYHSRNARHRYDG